MLPPHQQPKSGVLHTSLTLVPGEACGSPNIQERGSNSDQIRDSPTESASSRETWPTPDPLTISKPLEAEHSVIRHITDKMSLRDISRERVDIIADRMHHLPNEYLDKLKNELRGLIEGMGDPCFSSPRTVRNLGRYKDWNPSFLHPTVSLSQASLIEIFLYKRCRNIACGNQIPADNCMCEICVKRNGFCNLCMCVICSKFDFEVNTCRWIGCDVCSHWTHTDCAIHNAQIGNGGSLGEMVFRCRACMRTSELFGWVKDVFHHCAPLWDREALVRELEYVSRIFRGSEECGELVEKLKTGVAEPVASKAILSFFQEFDIDPRKHEESGGVMALQEAFNRIADVVQEAIKKMEMVEEEKVRMTKKARLALEACDQELKDKAREVAALKMERQKKKQQVEELQSIVRLKQAEAEMFDLKAAEARREADRLQRFALAKVEKSEDDYASRYLKQRLHEAEAEKQYLFEKMNSGSSGGGGGGGGGELSQMMMYNKIQDLLKNMYTVPTKGDGQAIHSCSNLTLYRIDRPCIEFDMHWIWFGLRLILKTFMYFQC
uniref:OBERON-like protein n=1 Tax=Lactuca sativa TaxID=4236 RepID=A0A9R1X7E9_LACSA|nr:hypothetical protein LSAT_V11C600322850 [Lactuca sativa]